MIRTPDGCTWKRIDEAAADHRTQEATIRKWIQRRRVAHFVIDNRTWVRSDDVADCEREKHWREQERDTPA